MWWNFAANLSRVVSRRATLLQTCGCSLDETADRKKHSAQILLLVNFWQRPLVSPKTQKWHISNTDIYVSNPRKRDSGSCVWNSSSENFRNDLFWTHNKKLWHSIFRACGCYLLASKKSHRVDPAARVHPISKTMSFGCLHAVSLAKNRKG